MTKEILRLTATLLGLGDVIKYIDEENGDEQAEAKVDELIFHLNKVVREITGAFYPLTNEELLISNKDAEIDFATFSKTPCKIREVINRIGLGVDFQMGLSGVKVGLANYCYKVKYNYLPEPVTKLSDPLNLPIGLEAYIVCYGIAEEYALSRLLYDEAQMWRAKYVNSLDKLINRISEKRFAARKLK